MRRLTPVIHRLYASLSPPLFLISLSLTRLTPHCGLINTFWPSQLLVFCSVTIVPVVIPYIWLHNYANATTVGIESQGEFTMRNNTMNPNTKIVATQRDPQRSDKP
ncbi:hypothetical protein ACTXT7_017022, partial [Hymenolepis weldensis]